MVVDDDPLINETLAAILKASGLAAITAPNAHAALDLARVIPPEIVITDMTMPGLSGLELAIELTRAVPDCDVILFYGQTTTTDIAGQMRRAGVNYITLAKPVHPADLLDAVSELLGRRGYSIEMPKPIQRPSLYDVLRHSPDGSPAQASHARRLRPRSPHYV